MKGCGKLNLRWEKSLKQEVRSRRYEIQARPTSYILIPTSSRAKRGATASSAADAVPNSPLPDIFLQLHYWGPDQN